MGRVAGRSGGAATIDLRAVVAAGIVQHCPRAGEPAKALPRDPETRGPHRRIPGRGGPGSLQRHAARDSPDRLPGLLEPRVSPVPASRRGPVLSDASLTYGA